MPTHVIKIFKFLYSLQVCTERHVCICKTESCDSKLNYIVSVGSLQEMKVMNIHYIMSLHTTFTSARLPPTLRVAGA